MGKTSASGGPLHKTKHRKAMKSQRTDCQDKHHDWFVRESHPPSLVYRRRNKCVDL